MKAYTWPMTLAYTWPMTLATTPLRQGLQLQPLLPECRDPFLSALSEAVENLAAMPALVQNVRSYGKAGGGAIIYGVVIGVLPICCSANVFQGN